MIICLILKPDLPVSEMAVSFNLLGATPNCSLVGETTYLFFVT